MVNVWGKEISEEELEARYKRGMKLKYFACFPDCATYPHCNRLSSPNSDDLLSLKERAMKKINEIIGERFGRGDYLIKITIKCKEFREKGIDFGD